MQATGLKILVIEDRRENIVFLANTILKPKGFEVITARDGRTGLRKALEEGPDLIIADLNLPKISGLEIVADLRDRGAQIPVIVTTLHGSESLAVQAFRLGVADYLVKPLKDDDVEAALSRVLSLRSTEKLNVNLNQVTQLENEISQLKATIQQQVEKITTYHNNEVATNIAPEHNQSLENSQEIIDTLTQQLHEQQQLTTEARNQAKAFMQFILAQQKEIDRQKQDAAQALKQLGFVTDKLHAFMQRIDNQAAQFKLIAPNTESTDAPQ